MSYYSGWGLRMIANVYISILQDHYIGVTSYYSLRTLQNYPESLYWLGTTYPPFSVQLAALAISDLLYQAQAICQYIYRLSQDVAGNQVCCFFIEQS